MPIKHPPYSGQIIICDYTGFIVPEMVKKRPVVVVSPKPRSANRLCVVIPLSTTAPHNLESHHIEIVLPDELVSIAGFSKKCWAKCNMINTVSYQRLELVRFSRNASGKRNYSYHRVGEDVLFNLRKAAAGTFGIKFDKK